MMKVLRVIILTIFLIQMNGMPSMAADASLTVIRPWVKDANVNGAFEEKRRTWLAKIRIQKDKVAQEENSKIILR